MATGAAIGMGLSSFALSKREADSQLASAQYTEQQLRANAAMSNLQAEDAIKRGDAAARSLASQTRSLIGSQRAAAAASGIDVESGSALDIQLDTAALSAEDQKMIKANAWREAWGYRVEAEDLYGQAAMTRLAGKSAYKTGIMTGMFNAAAMGISTYKSLGGSGSGASQQQFTKSGTPVPRGYELSPSGTGYQRIRGNG